MNPTQIAEEARKFLRRYISKKRWFSPPDVATALLDDPEDEEALANVILMFSGVSSKEGTDEMRIAFFCGSEVSDTDPAVKQAAEECVREAKAAIPDLAKFKIEVQVDRGM
jgi:hypothetical protein